MEKINQFYFQESNFIDFFTEFYWIVFYIEEIFFF